MAYDLPGFAASASGPSKSNARAFLRASRAKGRLCSCCMEFPQTHVCWARIAPQLAQRFTVVLADLTGYGDSRGPPVEEDGVNYSKRAVAQDMVALMPRSGTSASIWPATIEERVLPIGLRSIIHIASSDSAALSILPTFAMWRRLADLDKAINAYHWFLLAQKPPIPHDLLAGAPGKQIRNTLASWTKAQDLQPFTPFEIAAYEHAYSRPDVIAAVCAEYRASWKVDRELDEADVARRHQDRLPCVGALGYR